jgi:pyruvate/2-oxoglutarate dehydrogenase complex dihydrolipoamide acyltransferase (E2) component
LTQVILDEACWDGVDDPETEALVESWLVKEGASVRAGQPLANVVVVKTNYEVTATADGILRQILVPAEGTFARGTPLALIDA